MGILFVILSIAIGVTAPPLPTTAADGAAVLEFYTAHRSGFMFGNFLGMLALIPAIPMYTYTAYRIRLAEGAEGWLWLMSLFAGLIAHAVGMVDLAIYQVASLQTTPELAKLANDLGAMCFAAIFPALTGCAWAVSIASLTVGGFGRWTGISGVIVGLVCLVVSFGALWPDGVLAVPGPATGGAFLLYIAWTSAMAAEIAWRPANRK